MQFLNRWTRKIRFILMNNLGTRDYFELLESSEN